MPETRVDIAIPTHGEGQYLGAAVASVLGQTFKALTLTVMENGPGGAHVAEVLRPFSADPRLRHEVTGGVPQAENWTRCIQTGSAPYVVLLPHDDAIDPEFLGRRVALLDAHPEAAFAFGGVRMLTPDGSVDELRLQQIPAGLVPSEVLVPLFYEENQVPTSSMVVRRTAYEAVGARFDAEHRMGIDWEMWLRLAVRFPAIFVPLTDSTAYVHEDSVTARSRGWGEMLLGVSDRADELIAEHMPGYTLPARVRARARGYAHLRSAFERMEDGDRSAAWRSLRVAVGEDRLLLASPRVVALVVALLGGEGARARVAQLRQFEARFRLRSRLTSLRRRAGRARGSLRDASER